MSARAAIAIPLSGLAMTDSSIVVPGIPRKSLINQSRYDVTTGEIEELQNMSRTAAASISGIWRNDVFRHCGLQSQDSAPQIDVMLPVGHLTCPSKYACWTRQRCHKPASPPKRRNSRLPVGVWPAFWRLITNLVEWGRTTVVDLLLWLHAIS